MIPRNALAHGLALMAEVASQHDVRWIESCATVVELDDVVAIDATPPPGYPRWVIRIVALIATLFPNRDH